MKIASESLQLPVRQREYQQLLEAQSVEAYSPSKYHAQALIGPLASPGKFSSAQV